uniref:Uncharacterized protein n=1 Tax=Takifugu rubripes TaxID=31033 RepID=A0A3B5KFG5_TAKRU
MGSDTSWWQWMHTLAAYTGGGSRKRSQGNVGEICLGYTGVILDYIKGSDTTFQFDLCEVIGGCRDPGNWRNMDVYLCMYRNVHQICQNGYGPRFGAMCPGWDYVNWWTGQAWSASPPHGWSKENWEKITFTRGLLARRNHKGLNPLLFSIKSMHYFPEIINNKGDDRLFIVLGVHVGGQDPKGIIQINFRNNSIPVPTLATPVADPNVVAVDFSKFTAEDVVKIVTGYGDVNIWLEWIQATAKDQKMTNCVACSAARPKLYTALAPLLVEADPQGFHCMLSLHMYDNPVNCSTLSDLFPVVSNKTAPPTFVSVRSNFTCLSRMGRRLVGDLPSTWCKYMVNVTTWSNASHFPVHRADLFWHCDPHALMPVIPPDWSGTCTLVRLLLPITLLSPKGDQVLPSIRHRRGTSFDLTQGSPTYIDSIGIPRGVPDEYKLVDQVSAGFENLPLISALFPITPNKNVDRINYVHYNVQRLANLTRDAVAGLSEQVAATSLMTVQNRMALDMLLAEKGGVCAMFGDQCCTFIPNNTAPDGSVTRALEGLRTLSDEMKEHSGVTNPLQKWMDRMFGKWKVIIVSVLMSLISATAGLILCGCCCIPCIRSLCNRIIVTAIEGKQPPPYQMAQIRRETIPLMGVSDGEI